jgi:replicative DNA helicase
VELLVSTGDLNVGWHEDQVIDFSVRRATQRDADRFREVIADLSVPANQLIGGLTHAVTSKALGRAGGATTGIADQVDDAMEKLAERMRNPDTVHGLSLGVQFPRLTRSLQGLQTRRLVTLTATSGKGKSTIGIQWQTQLAIGCGVPCDFVSLEMDHDEVIYKAASHITGIDSMKISGGDLDETELRRVERAMMLIRKSPWRIYAPDGITPSEFVLYCREAVMDRRSECFVLDFIQQVGPDPETRNASRYEQLGQAAYMLKQKVCRGMDVSVVAIAQLKRDAAGKEEPTPEDMGDSYEIVRASDVIVILNETPDAGHEIWIGKSRQGPGQVNIPAYYDKPTQTWREGEGEKDPTYRVLSA